MRCPHCAGEILDGSRFCGICGRQCAAPAAPLTLPPDGRVIAGERGDGNFRRSGISSMSLFELPVSRGARFVRVFAVLALDVALIVAGIAMIISYVNARARARGPAASVDAGVAAVRVEASTPTLVEADSDDSVAESSPDDRRASMSTTRTKSSNRGTSGGGTSGGGTSGGGTSDSQPDPVPSPDPAPDPAAEPADAFDAGASETSTEPTPEQISVVARQIGLLVDRHNGRLQRCYSQSAKVFTPDDPLVGTVEIQFVLVPGGTVENVRIVSNSTGSSDLAGCVVGLVKSWSFPEPPGSVSLPFAWPFNFKAPK